MRYLEGLLVKDLKESYRAIWLIVKYSRLPIKSEMCIYSDEILPGLHLGSQDAVKRSPIKWTHIVSLRERGVKIHLPKGVSHYRIVIEDEEGEPIREHFYAATEWMHEVRQNPKNKLLIHCHAGISRSPTLVAAYLVRFYHLSLDHALELINWNRTVLPNSGFLSQLQRYATRLHT
jgi:protein-tyrosine phosphatase